MSHNFTWQPWQPIGDAVGTNSSAVYLVRLVEAGMPAKIQRFLKEDGVGILSIGETACIHQRHGGYKSSVEVAKGHSSGNLFTILNLNSSGFREKYTNPMCYFTYTMVKGKDDAKRLQDRLLKAYFLFFGELPPFNTEGFNRKLGYAPDLDWPVVAQSLSDLQPNPTSSSIQAGNVPRPSIPLTLQDIIASHRKKYKKDKELFKGRWFMKDGSPHAIHATATSKIVFKIVGFSSDKGLEVFLVAERDPPFAFRIIEKTKLNASKTEQKRNEEKCELVKTIAEKIGLSIEPDSFRWKSDIFPEKNNYSQQYPFS